MTITNSSFKGIKENISPLCSRCSKKLTCSVCSVEKETDTIKEVVKATDNVEIKQFRDGEVIAERSVHNLVVTAGLTEVALLLRGSGTAFGYVAIGTGTTAAVIGDTALETEIQRGAATTGGSGADEIGRAHV